MKEYKITKEQCQQQIHGVCEGCGGKLEPIETVDNSHDPTFWVGCTHCSCFRSGVERIYFEIARELVKENILIPYQTAGLSHTIKLIHNMLNKKLLE